MTILIGFAQIFFCKSGIFESIKRYSEKPRAVFVIGFFQVRLLGLAVCKRQYGSIVHNIFIFIVPFYQSLGRSVPQVFYVPLVNTYAEKAYKDSTLAFFAVLSDRMDRDTVGAWFDRAAKDGKVAFASVFDD